MMKRLIGLMVLALASVGAHAQSWVLPSAVVSCACKNVGDLTTAGKAFWGYWGHTPPGYKAGLILTPAGYNGAANSTRVAVISTLIPIAGWSYSTYSSSSRTGNPVVYNYFSQTTNAAAIAWDNAYLHRGTYMKSQATIPGKFQGATPAQIIAVANTYIGIGATVSVGFPISTPLIVVSVAPAIDNYNNSGQWLLISGMEFVLLDPTGWGAIYTPTYDPATNSWSYTLDGVMDAGGEPAAVGPDGTYQSATPPTSSIIGPDIGVGAVPGTMNDGTVWPSDGQGELGDPTGGGISINASGNFKFID